MPEAKQTVGTLLSELKAILHNSECNDWEVLLKTPAGGQLEELVVRRATMEEKRSIGFPSHQLAIVLAAEGDNRLTLGILIKKLRGWPESAAMFAMRYLASGEGILGEVVVGPGLLHDEKESKRVIAVAAEELPPRNQDKEC